MLDIVCYPLRYLCLVAVHNVLRIGCTHGRRLSYADTFCYFFKVRLNWDLLNTGLSTLKIGVKAMPEMLYVLNILQKGWCPT
jgi:hypothetical protein